MGNGGLGFAGLRLRAATVGGIPKKQKQTTGTDRLFESNTTVAYE